jgi:radical SAM protein with 4Fe4S-binding SPASM domain
METQGYAEFSLNLHQRVAERRIPICGTIELTRRCPLNCVHCYNNLPPNDPGARRKELTMKEHFRVLDEIAAAGCLWLLFTGGEIFAREDFWEIYLYAKNQGLVTTLFTNGTLVDEEAADRLAEWRPLVVEITIYGRTKETHERITRTPGSYDRCLRGIRLLQERNLPLKLKTMVLAVNRHEVSEMKRWTEEELGVEFLFDAMINPRLDGSPAPLALRLPPEEVVALDAGDRRRMAEWKRFAGQFVGPLPAGCQDKAYQCGGGLSSFAIDPYGKLGPCLLARDDVYDLRRGSFVEGWEKFLPEVRRRKNTRMTKCTECEIKSLCGMCPANGLLESRDPETPVDFLCRVAHLRAQMLGVSVKPHGDCQYCEARSA